MDISRRGLLSGAGVLGGAAVLGTGGVAGAAPVRAKATERRTAPPGIDSISSPPEPGVTYRFASWLETTPADSLLYGRLYEPAGVYSDVEADFLATTFEAPPGAIAHDIEVYCSATKVTFAEVFVWATGVADLAYLIAGFNIGPFADSEIHATKFTIPKSQNGPFPHGTKLGAYLSTAKTGEIGLNGFRVGFKNAPLSTVLLTSPTRVYNSSSHGPLKPGQTRTISLSSHLPVGANGALCSLSVSGTHSHGTLHVGAAGSALTAVGLQWSRTGDRVTAPVTSALSSRRSIAVQSTRSSGTTDFTVDLIGYLV